MNLSGTLNAFKVLLNPGLCLPHYTVSTFNDIPVPLSRAFRHGEKPADIRAVILDKDNCFAIPHQDEIHAPYRERFQELRKAYPGSRLLIVSNTAGTHDDRGHASAEILEKNTGVQVLRHSTKKPGCGDEIMAFLRSQKDVDITSPSQVVVVGDRLLTDTMMANMMGSYGVWVKDGIPGQKGFVSRLFSIRAELTMRSSQTWKLASPNFFADADITRRIQEQLSSDVRQRCILKTTTKRRVNSIART